MDALVVCQYPWLTRPLYRMYNLMEYSDLHPYRLPVFNRYVYDGNTASRLHGKLARPDTDSGKRELGGPTLSQ